MNKTKVVFFDIDGTLLFEGRAFFEEDREAMDEAAARGHFLFLNTGRSFANIPSTLLDFPSIKGIAAGGGAHILLADSADSSTQDSGRFTTFYRQFIPEDALAEIVAWYVKTPRCCFLEGERDCYIINKASRLFTVKPSVPVTSFEDFKKKSAGDFITKLTMDGFMTEEDRAFLGTFLKLNPFADYSEGIIKGENKAKAMEIILEKIGIAREDSIAIGDGINDLDMIRYAGLGVAMGNACPELKAEAGAVTGNCGQGGVARMLRKYAL
jgi:Cof subfamily protein (haloacid dehalogenase superfamily)